MRQCAAADTQPEWAAAFGQDPTGAQKKLLPVRVQECAPQGLLASLIDIDLVGKDEPEALDLLLKGVETDRVKPDTSPAFPGAARKKPAFPAASSSPQPKPSSTGPLSAESQKQKRTQIRYVRSFLEQSFDKRYQLDAFCTDNDLRIFAELHTHATVAEAIEVLLSYCERNTLLPYLLKCLAELNPRRYKQFKAAYGEAFFP